VYLIFLVVWTGEDNCVAVFSLDSLLLLEVCSAGLWSGRGPAFGTKSVA